MIKLPANLILFIAIALLSACDLFEEPDAAELLAQGQEYIAQGEWSAARIAFKNAARFDPENAGALYALADVNLRYEDAVSAESDLLKAQVLESAPAGLQALLAKAYYKQGKYSDVISLEIDPRLIPSDEALVLALQGMSYLNLRQWSDAERRFSLAQEADEKSVPALIGLSRLEASRGELGGARTLLEQALIIDESNPETWSERGNIDRLDGKYADAVTAYDKAIEQQLIGSRDRISRIFLQIQLKSYAKAQSDIAFLHSKFNRLPAVDYAEGLIYFHQESYAKAQLAFDKTLAASPDYLPAIFYLGASHFRQQHEELALEYLQKFNAEVPDDINAVRMMAVIRLKNSEFDQAEALMRPIVERDPQDTASLSLLASALLRSDKVEESVSLLERVVELEPDSAAARMGLGIGLLTKGETAEGVQQLAKVQELDPELEVDLGTVVLLHLQNRAFEEAVKAARQAVETYPDNVNAHFLLGTALQANGNKDDAKEAFNNSISIDAGHISSLYALASIALQERAVDEAKALYREVLTHSPGDLKSLRGIAVIEGAQGNEQAMLEALELAAAKNPDALPPRLSLGRYYSKANQPQKVVEILQGVRLSHPENPTLLALLGESQLAIGNYQSAVNDLSALCRLAPGSVWAHYQLAQAYAGVRDARNFESELLTVLELDESHFPARLNLARYYLAQDKLDLAELQIDRLAPPAAQEDAVFALRGRAAAAEGDNTKAIEFYVQAFAKRDSNINMLRLEEAYWMSGDKKSSLELLSAWLAEHPEDQLSLLRLASRYMLQGRRSEALVTYKAVLDIAPQNVIALNNLAWELQDEDRALAIKYAEKAGSLAPDSTAVMDTLAVLYTGSDAVKAEKYIMRALDVEPENPAFLFHRAKILISLGDSQSARSLLRSLLGDYQEFDDREEAGALLDSLLYSEGGPGQG